MENEPTEDMIQHEMADTRASLTEKLEALEHKLMGTFESATTAVTDTVDAIKETVHETVVSVQDGVKGSVDTVKEVFDLPGHVQRHPWWVFGGSIAAGYCIGVLLSPKQTPTYNGVRQDLQVESQPAPPPRIPVVPEPGIWDLEVHKLKSLALGVLFGTARELLSGSVPAHMGDQLNQVVDGITRKMGGEPIPSSDWAKFRESTASQTK